MSIKAGDKVPSVKLKRLGDNGMEEINIADYVKDKKVVIFAVPGAFTPTCSQKHLPGYVKNADTIKSEGVDEIICIAVNDPFVMKEWGKSAEAEGKVTLLPDGNGEFTKAVGMELDASGHGLGKRSQRYMMVVDNGTVESVDVEPNPGEETVSGAKACVAKLK